MNDHDRSIDSTERQRGPDLPPRREQQFEVLAEHLPDLVARFDRDGRYVYVNSAVERLTGTPREAMLGRTQRELGMPGAIATLFEESLAAAARTGVSHTVEFCYPAAGGDRLFEAHHVPEYDASGAVATVLCVARDITGRKRAEEELQRQKKLLTAIIDNLPVGIFIKDAATLRLLLANRASRVLLKHPREAAIGKTPHELFPAEQADAFCRTDRQAFESGKMVEIVEQSVPGRSGATIIQHVRKVPLFDERGEPWVLVGISDDITERKRTEQVLRDSEARFELAVEHTGLGMWDWNLRTSEVWRHPRWARVLGYEPEEVPGHICMWQEFCHPDDWPQVQERLLAHFAGETPVYRAHYRMRNKRGSWIWIGCRGIVIEREQDGTPLRMLGYIRDITERKVMEQALRESQAQFRAVTETANDAIVSVDSAGDIVYFNQAASRTFGYSVEEALGGPLTLLMPARPGDAHRDGLQGLISGHPGSLVGKTTELVARRKDGTEFPVELSLASWRTDGGVFLTGIVRDLSNRRRREELQSTLAAIVNTSADAIMSKDLGGIIRTWNPGAERLFGYRAEEVIGQSVLILLPADVRDEEALILQRIRRGERVEHFRSVRCRKDGTPIDVSLTISPVTDVTGCVVGASTIVRDITGPLRAENALRESEERFRQLAENIAEVFWINTPAGNEIVYVSPAYEEIWGRSCESLYRNPHSWMDAVHPEDLAAVKSAVERMREGRQMDAEFRIVRPDGTLRWIRDRSYPMKRQDGTSFHCGIAEDITARKRAEEERLTQAIHQRDALVREVHHRIKNHLQGIAGLLRNKAADDPAAAETIDAAVAQLQSVAVVYGLQSELAESGVPLCRVLEAICASAEGLSTACVVRAFAADAGGVQLAATEAVPVAVALNELVFNAIEHGARRGGTPRIDVALSEKKDGADIRIVNRGRLPARFDYPRAIGTGTGLGLVKTLLGPSGGKLAFSARGGKVEVNLSLRPPLVTARKRPAGTSR